MSHRWAAGLPRLASVPARCLCFADGNRGVRSWPAPLVRLVVLLLVCGAAAIQARQPALELVGTDELPAVAIDGRPATIHTQGLFVSPRYYYVTGRLESEPKRPLLLRFDRGRQARYEFVPLTPAPSLAVAAPNSLDHPGGFDYADGAFWIPVARSSPRGPSVVWRVRPRPDKSLAEYERDVAFEVDDHIGAIACDPSGGLLYGANWDTQSIYVWDASGELQAKLARDQLVGEQGAWQLAVQDWKSAETELFPGPGVLVAGGLDRSIGGADEARAVVEFLQPGSRKSLARLHPPQPAGATRPVTNEGLAIVGSQVFLLPEDIGRGARVYRYRLRP